MDFGWPFLGGFIASVLTVVVARISEVIAARKQLHLAKELEFQKALSSESLLTLGVYLDRTLGPFRVADYERNSAIKERVDSLIARLQDYVGDYVVPEEEPDPPELPSRAYIDPDDESEFQHVQTKFLNDDLWDALATLRRLVEMRLRALATRHELPVQERAGARVLLETLARHRAIDDATAARLRFVIDVCNRAIHGFDVYIDETDEAIEQARAALASLPRN